MFLSVVFFYNYGAQSLLFNYIQITGYGGTEGQLTPQAVWAQMPEGFDRLDEKTNLVMRVDGETPLRNVLRDGDDVWIMFQNRKPSRVIAAGGEIDKKGKRIKPNLINLQREQFEVDQARAWLKRTCRDDQEVLQLRIAKIFREMQEVQGRSIRDIFIAFDDDGGGTIDHEELRDGFDALGIDLDDNQFKRMLSVWDESGDGEIDFEEFAEMFERTQLMLDVDGRRKLISFDAFNEVPPKILGITEEKRIVMEKREYDRSERTRKRLEAEAKRLAELNGDTYEPDKKKSRVRKIPWTLDRSVWAPRKLETDSKTYFDTEDLFRQSCLADFRHAHRIIKLIKNGADYLSVQDYLASQYRKLLGCYRMWCASDEQFGPFQMTHFAFKEFATTATGICDNKIIQSRDLDNVFATVNATVSTGTKKEKKNKDRKSDNTSKSIVRYEFLESIVRLALRRFPIKEDTEIDSGLKSIRKLCEEFVLPSCKSEWNLDDFRRNHMYLEGVHHILHDDRFRDRLRDLYDEGVKRAKMNDRNVKLLNLKGFIKIMCFPIADDDEEKAKDKKALDDAFAKKAREERRESKIAQESKTMETGDMNGGRTMVNNEILEHAEIHIEEEDATLAFAMSQMTTIDEEDRSSNDARRDSSDFATYVEYLEAIVRVALKTMRGLEVEMLTTPQKLERFLCTVLFPSVGLPKIMFCMKRRRREEQHQEVEEEEEVEEVEVKKKKKKKKKKGGKKKGKGKGKGKKKKK